jgi:glycosyltransferase involved in cell wall biosynthesis
VNWPLECAAVIPCFNESATLATLVRQVRDWLPEVWVVDDGSTDATAECAEKAGARVLRHVRNRGKGAALRTGLRAAQRRGLDWAISLDGDGQHAPGEIPAFLRCAENTGARLVVGNRMGAASQMPWLRRAANRWMSRQLSRQAGRFLPDTQCGFRLLHLESWARLPLHTEHFEVESETLLAFLAFGHRVEFVPIPVLPSPRPSRIHFLPDTLRWFRWWRQVPRPAHQPAADPLPTAT